MLSISTLSDWNQSFDEEMRPLIAPDMRGQSSKITADLVRRIIEAARALRVKRIRIKKFTKHLQTEHNIVLSHKKVTEILIANGLYKASTRKRRAKYFQSLRQSIPNGLVSIDGSELTVWLDNRPYKFNLELSVDVESFCHTAFSISDSETTEEFIKVMESHKDWCGTPLGIVSDHGSANLSIESRAYLERNNIEILAAGPANPKGNGTAEGAFSQLK